MIKINRDHFLQYIQFIYGLNAELNLENKTAARNCYMVSLTGTLQINHYLRKKTLERLIKLSTKEQILPQVILLQRYYISQKYLQVMVDASSFSSKKALKQVMTFANHLFGELNP